MVPAAQVTKEQGRGDGKDVPARRAVAAGFHGGDGSLGERRHAAAARMIRRARSRTAKRASRSWRNPPIAHSMAVAKRQGRGTAPPELYDPKLMRNAWDMTVKAANEFYEPGKFTTFIGYEWSAAPDGKNLHRNVIFNADHAPLPLTGDETSKPEELWTYLESAAHRASMSLRFPTTATLPAVSMYDWNMSDGRPSTRTMRAVVRSTSR